MPIDLTKPIRHKGGGPAIVSAEEVVVVKFENEPGSVYTVKREAFEANYENIPEPRKPRGFFMCFNPRRLSYEAFATMAEAQACRSYLGPVADEVIRVIEWPEGAELPELP